MALPLQRAVALFLLLILANVSFATCRLLKGSVTCLDCSPHHNLSGVVVGIKCNQEERLLPALTNNKGYLEIEIAAANSSSPPPDCIARLLGGREQLCSFEKSMVSKIVVKAPGPDDYALSTPLTFFTSCAPYSARGKTEEMTGADEPRAPDATPPEPKPRNQTGAAGWPAGRTGWGSSIPLIVWFPFLPIIGIP